MHTFFELIGVGTTIIVLFIFILMAMGVLRFERSIKRLGDDER